MNDPDDAAMPGDQAGHGLPVGDVEAFEDEAVAFAQCLQPRFLQWDVVVVVDVVDADDVVAPVQQGKRSVKTDEAGGAGNQNRHVKKSGTPLSRPRIPAGAGKIIP